MFICPPWGWDMGTQSSNALCEMEGKLDLPELRDAFGCGLQALATHKQHAKDDALHTLCQPDTGQSHLRERLS